MPLVFSLLASAVAADPPATPEGRWRTIDDRTGRARAIVRIRMEDGRLRGQIEHVFPRPGEPPDPVCKRCSGARRGQRVIGMAVLWDHRLEQGRWTGGRLFDPEAGKEYRGQIWLEAPDTLRVRGHWGPFHRTQTWQRLREEEGRAPLGALRP